jgi:hypothetical protein
MELSTYQIPAIPYLRLHMTLEAEEEAFLPPYQGSMLRGAFGHALRRTACTMGPKQPCASCPLRRACAYTRLFEPYIEGEPPPFLRGVDQAVRPYVFEPRSQGGRLEPGDPLHFDLLLFGQAADLQAYALLAVERMARSGLGARRARFRLIRAEATAPALAPGGPLLPPGPVACRLLTPLRVKVRDHLSDRPTFRDLAFNMLRRILELAHFHVPGAAIDWSFRAFLNRAEGVRMVSAGLRWHDWERWSQRQQKLMKLGGIVGELVLEGEEIAPFLPLLSIAEVVHVGKGATFGLGKIELKPL